MTSRMVGSVLTLLTLLFSAGGGAAQTYTQMQWGMNKGVTPYQFGANINGSWSNLGTVSSAGVWGLTPSTLTVSGAATFNNQITNFPAATAGIELGSTSVSNTPFIDFRSSGLNNDFDARILASGGTSTPGRGTLTITASNSVTFPGKVTFNAPKGNTSIGTGLALNTALQDLSSVIAAPSTFFFPDFYGNPANGTIHRANRLFLGEASSIGAYAVSGVNPVLPVSWMDQYLPSGAKNAVHYATLSVGDPIGINAITGYSRTSDFNAWSGSASGGSQAVNAFAINDDVTPATTPIAVPFFGLALRLASVNGITLNQFDTGNAGNTVDTDPYVGINSGSTWGLGLTAGFAVGSTNPITGYLYLGDHTAALNPEKQAEFGIIALSTAFDPTKGNGGNGIFAKLARGQSVQWINSLSTVDAEIYAVGDGLHAHNTNLTVDYNIFAGAAIVSKGTKPTATGSGGTCAAGTVAGGAIAGTVTLTGVCASTDTLALTGMPAATTGFVCDAADRTNGVLNLVQTATTTTSATFTFNASTGATDVIQFKCIGY